MSLQPIELPFGPLNTADDPAYLPPGTLTLAENVSSQTGGIYEKRNGYAALAAGAFTTVKRLIGRRAELVVTEGQNLFRYFPALATWGTAGRVAEPQTAARFVIEDDTTSITKSTRATANGITVHAWLNAGNLYVMAEAGDGVAMNALVPVDSSAVFDCVHVAAAGTLVAIFYSSTAGQVLRFIVYDTVAGAFTGVASTFKSGANVYAVSAMFDVTPLSSTDVVVVWASNTPNIQAARFTVSTGVAAATAIISAEVPSSAVSALATVAETGYALYYSAAAGGLRACCFNPSTMVQTVAPFAVEAVVAGMGLAGLARFDATHAMAIWGRAAVGIVKSYVTYATISNAGVTSALTRVLRNVDLATKPFVRNGVIYANVYAKYLAQCTYFTIRLRAAIGADAPHCFMMAMHAYRTAYSGGLAPVCVPEADAVSADSFWFDLPIDYKSLASISALGAIQTFGCDFASPTMFLSCEIGDSAVIPNGIVTRYDGHTTVEQNFLLYPEITQATPGAVGAAGMDDGSYAYIAIFTSTDANGNTARSTTSLIKLATTSAGAGLGKVTLTGDHLTMSRQGVLASANTEQQGLIAIYRTQKNVSLTYYLLGYVSMSVVGTNWTYVDQANDSAIASNPILYTSGGVLDREPPLPALQTVVHQGRVWGISSADRRLLFYSGLYSPGESAWFSSLQQLRVDVGGDLTAIASMDDKLLLFKADRVFKVYGNGPNALGQNNDLTNPILLTGDCGCIDPRSTVTTPTGVMFQSNKGVYEVSRGEQLTYKGSPAHGYWQSYANVVSAEMLPDRREVRFEVASPIPPLASPLGQKVVFNYETGQWTTHRNYLDAAAVDSIVVGGVYYWATATGAVYAESATSFRDPASTYVVEAFEMGWLPLAGRQGFARTSRALLLADQRAPHGLEMQIAKDYVDVYTQSAQYSAATLATLSKEQLAMHVMDQKGEAVRIRVSDYEDGASSGEGFAARGLLVYAKPIRGTFEKLMAAGAKA